MAISASDVKKLREMTGAGMMDCKKALTETDGDFDEAVKFLKKKGLASAEKKAGRIAAEGIVSTVLSDDAKTGTIIEVNSETDFVAKNEVFQTYVSSLAKQINDGDYKDMAAFLADKSAIDPSVTVEEHHKQMVAKIGENLSIRRFEKISGDLIVSYIHAGGKIGVLVQAETDNAGDGVKEALSNIAMQIAAMNPQYVSKDDISSDAMAELTDTVIMSSLNDAFTLPKPILTRYIDKVISENIWSDDDKAAYEDNKNNKFLANFISDEGKAQLVEAVVADKDAISAEKMFSGAVSGRVAKQIKEISLLEQVYVRAEDKENVAAYIAKVAKDNGCTLSVKNFVRFETGEGLEKKSENFADEVAKQMGQ